MDDNFINRIIVTTLVLALIVYLIAGFYIGFIEALGLLAGAFWGMANLYLIKLSLEKWLIPDTRDHLMLFALLQLKFPLLYLAGYGLLRVFSPIQLVVGISLICLAIFILGIHRAMTQKKGLL